MALLDRLYDELHYLSDAVASAVVIAIQAFATSLTVHSVVQIALLSVNVIVVLATIYLRPIRTRKQLLKVLMYLFAGTAICCMTVWLYFRSLAEGVAS